MTEDKKTKTKPEQHAGTRRVGRRVGGIARASQRPQRRSVKDTLGWCNENRKTALRLFLIQNSSPTR